MDNHYWGGMDDKVSRTVRDYKDGWLDNDSLAYLVLEQNRKLNEGTLQPYDRVFLKSEASDFLLRELCLARQDGSFDKVMREMDLALVLANYDMDAPKGSYQRDKPVDAFLHTSNKRCPVDNTCYELLAGIGYEPFRFVDLPSVEGFKDKDPVLPLMSYDGQQVGSEYRRYEARLLEDSIDVLHILQNSSDGLPHYPISSAVLEGRFQVGKISGESSMRYDVQMDASEAFAERYHKWEDMSIHGSVSDGGHDADKFKALMERDLEVAAVFANMDLSGVNEFKGIPAVPDDVVKSGVSDFVSSKQRISPLEERYHSLVANVVNLPMYGDSVMPYSTRNDRGDESSVRCTLMDVTNIRVGHAACNIGVGREQYNDKLMNMVLKHVGKLPDEPWDEWSDEAVDYVNGRIDMMIRRDPGSRASLALFDDVSMATLVLSNEDEAFAYSGQDMLPDADLHERLSRLCPEKDPSVELHEDLYVKDEDLAFMQPVYGGLKHKSAEVPVHGAQDVRQVDVSGLEDGGASVEGISGPDF